MITSVSNPQMKRIKELLNKSKQRRKEKCFVAEGIRMVAETPADRLERVYVSRELFTGIRRNFGDWIFRRH